MAGAFADIVTATLEVDTDELVDTASVIVEPGPVANVVLEPTEVTVDIGTTQPFSFKVFDANMYTPLKLFAREFGKPALNLVDP